MTTMDTWQSPFLSGLMAPVAEERFDVDLKVIGEIPRQLSGMFVRTGPNPQFAPLGAYHPFDGDGMLHAVYLQDGKAGYRNRWVESKGLLAERARGRACYGGMSNFQIPEPEVLEAAMCMQRAGADLSDIVRQTLNRMPFSTLHLWSRVLADAHLDQGVTWVTVSQEQLRQAGHEGDDSRLNSILSSINEADMSAIFTEKLGANGSPAVECSFRAKPGFKVGELAFQLGGGGHAPASGCTIAGTLDDVVGSVVPMLVAERRRQLAHTGATPQH